MQADVVSNSRPLVLVVEDDDGMRVAIRRLLSIAGFEAVLFESAEALLASGVPARARCLVLDVNLPGMSGFELQSHLAGFGTSPPVVFITADDQSGVMAQARASGSGYLVKPFPSAAFLKAIADAMAK